MDGLLVAVRAVHYAATIVLFGEMLFALLLGGTRHAGQVRLLSDRAENAACRRFRRVLVGAWAWMVISGGCWLALVAMQMSGQPLDEALAPSTLSTVLGSTVFGQAWSARASMALVLALAWPILRAGPPRQPRLSVLSVGITGGLLAGLAWAGHANAEVGADGLLHHIGDAAHLLAAGAWLGGLAPLAALLRTLDGSPTAREIDACTEIARRFGNRAALSVGVLLLTGMANAYYLVPTPRALLETTYGNVLLAKLLVFALMLAVAAANRTRLIPVLLANERDIAPRVEAAWRLRRNVWMEQALGAAVLVLVAALGVAPPPMRM